MNMVDMVKIDYVSRRRALHTQANRHELGTLAFINTARLCSAHVIFRDVAVRQTFCCAKNQLKYQNLDLNHIPLFNTRGTIQTV